MSWKVRSAARKSGRARPASTETTPTSVTFVSSTKYTFKITAPPTASGSTNKYTLTATITNPDGGTDSQALTNITVS